MAGFTLPRNSCIFDSGKTITFRLASRMITLRFTSPPREGKCGSNMQNWERSAKRIFISDGWNTQNKDEIEKLKYYLVTRELSIFSDEERDRIRIFVKRDQSGAEALIVAYLCRHGNFRSLFINNIKPHVFVALHLFREIWNKEMAGSGSDIRCDINELCSLGISDITSYPFWKQVDKLIKSSDKWTSDKRYYYIAKQVCHSSNYGIKAGMFSLNTLEKSKGRIVISNADAEKYLALYHGLFPEIHEWHRDVERQLSATKTLYNLFGYPRYFWFTTTHPNETVLKEAYAFPAQSTVGTISNIAFTNLQNFIEDKKKRWDLLNNEHDSIMAQCPLGEEDELSHRMGECINMPFKSPVDGMPFNMKSECKIGFNWSDYDEKDNPIGLKDF